MKRIVAVLALAFAVIGGAVSAHAQAWGSGNAQFNNREFWVSGCTSYTPPQPYPPAGYAICNDTVTGARYYWNGTKFTGATGCYWTVTAYGGAAPITANFSCLSSFSKLDYNAVNFAGTPTAVVTPGTTSVPLFQCAITAAGSTTVACVGPAGAPTVVIYGNAFN